MLTRAPLNSYTFHVGSEDDDGSPLKSEKTKRWRERDAPLRCPTDEGWWGPHLPFLLLSCYDGFHSLWSLELLSLAPRVLCQLPKMGFGHLGPAGSALPVTLTRHQ